MPPKSILQNKKGIPNWHFSIRSLAWSKSFSRFGQWCGQLPSTLGTLVAPHSPHILWETACSFQRTKACLNGHLEVVKALVATRANPNVYNDFRKRCSCATDGVFSWRFWRLQWIHRLRNCGSCSGIVFKMYLAAVANLYIRCTLHIVRSVRLRI